MQRQLPSIKSIEPGGQQFPLNVSMLEGHIHYRGFILISIYGLLHWQIWFELYDENYGHLQNP